MKRESKEKTPDPSLQPSTDGGGSGEPAKKKKKLPEPQFTLREEIEKEMAATTDQKREPPDVSRKRRKSLKQGTLLTSEWPTSDLSIFQTKALVVNHSYLLRYLSPNLDFGYFRDICLIPFCRRQGFS